MKHKVSELSGVLLDAAVAKAEGLDWGVGPNSLNDQRVCGVMLNNGWFFPWAPSTDWGRGGPILEREGVNFIGEPPGDWTACKGCDWSGAELLSSEFSEDGETMLIAGLRCVLASKFGEEVELP